VTHSLHSWASSYTCITIWFDSNWIYALQWLHLYWTALNLAPCRKMVVQSECHILFILSIFITGRKNQSLFNQQLQFIYWHACYLQIGLFIIMDKDKVYSTTLDHGHWIATIIFVRWDEAFADIRHACYSFFCAIPFPKTKTFYSHFYLLCCPFQPYTGCIKKYWTDLKLLSIQVSFPTN
jgi:hypothetical protein